VSYEEEDTCLSAEQRAAAVLSLILDTAAALCSADRHVSSSSYDTHVSSSLSLILDTCKNTV
jgi:hypothetical protein